MQREVKINVSLIFVFQMAAYTFA